MLAMEWFAKGGQAPLLLKSNLISTVHRHVPLDLAVVPVRDKDKVVGLSIHAGLWTSSALNAPPQDVPVLRSRLAALGHDATSISRITCPIGDPVLGKHPQAIAVGVAARLLAPVRTDIREASA